MAEYTFITLDVTTKAPLITHLKDACGIEADPKATINDLQDAILAFEENNGLERPNDLLPERLKTTDAIVPASTEATAGSAYVPIAKRNRRKVSIENNLNDHKDEYFQINEYKIRVVFGEVIELPETMINHIKGVKITNYKQEKDGTITPVVKHCYSVIEA